MRHLMRFLFIIFMCVNITALHADTISMQWLNEDGTTIYDTTTCNAGDDIILPTAPTKRGYTFVGWKKRYVPIEYLESTGTQWIDTGVTRLLTKKYKFVGNISYSDVITRQSNGAQGYVYFGVVDGYYQITNSSQAHEDVVATSDVFVPFEIEFDCPEKEYSYDILDVHQLPKQTTYQNNPAGAHFFLFSLNNGVLPSAEKISYFKIYSNNEIVRDFIPVLDPDGIPCMYDKVTDQFFYNAGTGDFIAGPVIGE